MYANKARLVYLAILAIVAIASGVIKEYLSKNTFGHDVLQIFLGVSIAILVAYFFVWFFSAWGRAMNQSSDRTPAQQGTYAVIGFFTLQEKKPLTLKSLLKEAALSIIICAAGSVLFVISLYLFR